jgi:uncharacterized protein involved in exopolysaccharide biosynthesis
MRIGIKSLQDFMSFLVRRRWWVIVPFIALSCLVAILTKELPKVFVSEALVIVKPRDVPENFVMDLNSNSGQQRLKSIQQMVLSRTNLVGILDEFESQMPDLRALSRDEAVDRLRKQISIRFSLEPDARGAMNVIYFTISCQDKNPQMAQTIVTRLTRLFLVRDSEERASKVAGTTDFLATELQKKETDLSNSDQSLVALKTEHIYELPERLDSNQRDLERLYTDKRSNEEALSRLASTRLGYEQLMAQIPEYLDAPPRPAALQEAKEKNPYVDIYLRRKAEYQEERAGHSDTHPNVLQAKARLDRARAEVPADLLDTLDNPKPAEKPAEVAPTKYKNPSYTSFENEMRNLRTEYDIKMSERKAIDEAIARLTKRVDNTPRVELALTPVKRTNEDLRKQRDELHTDLTKARLSESLESRAGGSQFVVQDTANLPAEAEKPNKWAVLGMGCLASLALSIAFAFIVDLARQRVWTQSEIESLWGVPVMVDIPAIVSDADQIALRKKKLAFATFFLAGFAVYSVFLYGVYLKQHYILQQLEPVLQTLVYR